jgi:hypothetical protein
MTSFRLIEASHADPRLGHRRYRRGRNLAFSSAAGELLNDVSAAAQKDDAGSPPDASPRRICRCGYRSFNITVLRDAAAKKASLGLRSSRAAAGRLRRVCLDRQSPAFFRKLGGNGESLGWWRRPEQKRRNSQQATSFLD